MLQVISHNPNASHVRFLELTPRLPPTRSIPRPPVIEWNSLLCLLSNHLILDHLAPYLTASSRLSLASTSRPFRNLVLNSPGAFRHLDLSHTSAAQLELGNIDNGGEVWRNVQLDEYLTEDECVIGPCLTQLPIPRAFLTTALWLTRLS